MIVITDEAKADLVEIGEFIRQDNPIRASSFIDELLDRCDALADMPRAYPLIPRYERYGIRRCVHRVTLYFIASWKTLLRLSMFCMERGSTRCYCFLMKREKAE